jgi:uncharacterized protein (DUF362 family)/Pyruvate/2-oxoacid:ferredoxin oxidoreductase delta subunit
VHEDFWMFDAVSLARCRSYDEEEVACALSAVLAPLGGMAAFVAPGMRVLVKPNLLSARPPERAVTTHPAVVRAVVEAVQACGGVPMIGDSPGGQNTPSSYDGLLKTTGMMGVIEETGCEYAYFDDESVTVPSPDGLVFRRFTIAKTVLDADAVICLPKLKTHQLTAYSGAVKVLYGCIPGIAKAAYHLHAGQDREVFADLLLDLHAAIPPSLSVMDAVVGMEGKGPQSGEARPVGLIAASASCTALDYAAALVVGLDPLSVPTIARAAARGTGPMRPDDLRVHGPSLAEVRVADFVPAPASPPSLPSFVTQFGGRLVAARPLIDLERCVGCGTCAAVCPPHAIAPGEIPQIDEGACIRCFCCQELCPEGAVEIVRPYLRQT